MRVDRSIDPPIDPTIQTADTDIDPAMLASGLTTALPLDDDDDVNDDGLPLLGSEPPQPREPQQRLQPPISRLSMRFGSDPVPASSSSGASSDSLGFTAAPLSSELARTSSNGASNDGSTAGGGSSSNVLTSSTSPQEGPTIVNRVLRNVTSPRSLAQSAPDNGGNAWRRSSTNAMTAPGTPPMKARLAGVRMSSSLSVLSSERSRKIESARSIDLDLLEELLQSETTFERHLGYCSVCTHAIGPASACDHTPANHTGPPMPPCII